MNAVISDWPSGSANTGWPQEPSAMLLPGRVEGWPAGTQRAASPAQRLLTQAVAYWDAAEYRDGDRFLRNLGTGGELLDLRLGSSIVANSNDPLWLSPEDVSYVYLPGVTGNHLRVPINDTLSGVIKFRAFAGGTGTIMGAAAYNIVVASDGKVRLNKGIAGGLSTNAVPNILDSGAWIEIEYTSATGAVAYSYSTDGGVTWTANGTATVNSGDLTLTDIFWGSQGGAATFTGKIYAGQLIDDGVALVDFDCDAITSGSATSFTAVTNQTVNVNRSTSGAARHSVAMPSRANGGAPLFLHGADDWFTPDHRGERNTHRFISLASNVLDVDKRCPDTYTIIGVTRTWPDTAPWTLMQQGTGTGGVNVATTAGGAFGLNTGAGPTCTPRLVMRGNFVATSTDGPTANMGSLVVAAATVVRNNIREVKTVYTNGVAGTPNSTPSGPDPLETAASRTFVGATTASAGNSGEFYALAYFRRALSADEIRTISNYFTGRIA